MPQFMYRAKQGPEKIVDGTIEAASLDAAIEKLDAMGLLPVRMDEIPENVAAKIRPRVAEAPVAHAEAAAPKGRGHLFGGVRSQEVTIFSRQLATLIKSGVPILRALQIIADQTANPKFRAIIAHAEKEIKDGAPLSSVMAQYPKLFPPIYLAMVRTGEDSGTLQEALYRIAEYRQRQEEIVSRIKTAMAYPILMALVGIGTVVFMLTFVIPRLTTLFERMGGNLPMPTKILMAVSGVFQSRVFWIGFVLIAAVVTLVVKSQKARVAAFWSGLSLKLPVLKGLTMKSELARASRTLELLLKSGVPILRAIEITAPVVGNQVLRGEFEHARGEVAGGASFGKVLKDGGIFPLFFTNLVLVGEESGHMDDALAEVAQFYERETDEALKVMTSLLEPLMILVMGLVVGFIVIAMLLPMFELNMMVK